MFKLFLITFLLSNTLFAYKSKNISFSDYEYRRFIKPQIKSIIADYQTLSFLLMPKLSIFQNDMNLIFNIFRLSYELKKDCINGHISDSCFKQLKNIETKTQSLINSNFKYSDINLTNIDKKNFLYVNYQSYQTELIHFLITTQNILFQRETLKVESFNIKIYINSISNLYNYFNIFINKALPAHVQNEFSAFWNGFIKKLDQQILINNEADFLKVNISRLNMLWNVLHQKLTKGTVIPTSQVQTLLQIMHTRWNNILKVALNPKA